MFCRINYLKRFVLLFVLPLFLLSAMTQCDSGDQLEQGFKNPPASAKSGVYWYFMDGNLSKEGITKDLEAMARVGMAHAIFLEVNAGIPRGKVDMLSPEWKDMFKHMVRESERLGIRLSLGTGPGWAGTGGPWVKVEESMKHLVYSSTTIQGRGKMKISLPLPQARDRFYGKFAFTPEQRKAWENYYEDVIVLAFPSPQGGKRIADIDEKSLYGRWPYSSMYGVKQFLPSSASYPELPENEVVDSGKILDVTSGLKEDGTLEWDFPNGEWTVMRFGVRNTGAVSSPAPIPGLGFETDKMDTLAIAHHLENFAGQLFEYVGFQKRTAESPYGGLAMLHFDSWEMGAQNWTHNLRQEFVARRGYDPQPYYPAYAGFVVNSPELTERFLWDLRKTIQELILENHLGYIKKFAHEHGLGLSIEPYDMTSTADLELAAMADYPMCEFWRAGFGFNTLFSVAEATSMAHLKGQPVVPAESFTAMNDGWDMYPGKLKNQTDWALASGINRFMFHTFVHQYFPDSMKPGMTMGGIGVHWNRNQTWWDMGKAYQDYLSRCQFLLQQGRSVADILYLSPEGNPHVFQAPVSAYDKQEGESYDMFYIYPNETFERVPAEDNPDMNILPDKKGYAFDACPPSFLMEASVVDGNIVFPSGATYRVLVLPNVETMTPELLGKIKELVIDGATVIGMPPKKSPSLQNYPQCDADIASLAEDIWEKEDIPSTFQKRQVGKGQIVWGNEILKSQDNLYADYDCVARILSDMGIKEDFKAEGLRYTHRTGKNFDVYFVSNRTGKPLKADCQFRVEGKIPELWDALTGEIREMGSFSSQKGQTVVPLEFEANQSYFVVFRKDGVGVIKDRNFPQIRPVYSLDKPWIVSFDTNLGGPKETTFDILTDWKDCNDDRIKYYSGSAIYKQSFNLKKEDMAERMYLDLGDVHVMAKVWLNGKEVGSVWTYPYRLDVSNYLKAGENRLEIEVVNLWVNRLIGDALSRDKQGKTYTFTTYSPYQKDSPLSESGLIGPVRVLEAY